MDKSRAAELEIQSQMIRWQLAENFFGAGDTHRDLHHSRSAEFEHSLLNGE